MQELVAKYSTSLWEFNLRDILRWSELVTTSGKVIPLVVQVPLCHILLTNTVPAVVAMLDLWLVLSWKIGALFKSSG